MTMDTFVVITYAPRIIKGSSIFAYMGPTDMSVAITYIPFSLLHVAATCRLLISFVNSLEPDQDRQSVDPDLDSNRLTL